MKASDYLDDKKPSASSFLDSDQPTGFKQKSLAELLSVYGQPNTLNEGARVVNGLPGVLEVGARRGYAGIGKAEQGALSILGDLLNSEALRNASDVVGNRARQIENSAVLRGQKQIGFAPDSIVNDIPEAGANAVSSVIQTAPSLLAGAIAPGAALPALFGQTFSQEYAQGKDAGLTPLKATGRAVPMAAFEVAGEKLGGFDRLAEGLRKATAGNGVADLGSAMLSSALREIPSEEFTTTGQFLTDKAPVIGINQDATLADYGQQVKDTALATALQSGAMGAGGRVLQRIAAPGQSVMSGMDQTQEVQPQPATQQINPDAIVSAISQATSNVKPSAAAFLDSDTTEPANVSQPTQQPVAGVDTATIGLQPDNGAGSPATELSQPNTNAGSDSAVPNGALPASDISDGALPAQQPSDLAQATNKESLPVAPVVNESLTTQRGKKPKANTLLSAIDGLGGIDNKYKWDISGEQKFARGGYNKVFRNASTKTLEQHIENGDLDEFLPYDMRSTVTDDPTAGRDYLADRIRNGDRVLPYDVELEAKQSKAYEQFNPQDDIRAIGEDIDLDEINRLLSEAGYVERETAADNASPASTGQIENTQPQSTNSNVDGGQRTQGSDARETATQNEVAGTPGSNEREGTRQQVETIVKRRAAANQIGKSKPFDNALKLAKDFMAGEPVSPAKFKNAATMFANDKPLADAFTALQELAKSPAKESRQNTRSAVDIFTEQINNAKTVDELRNIARNIQMETGVLNDAMARQLDDLVMARIDSLDAENNELIKKYGLPENTEFTQGRGFNKGKWVASANGVDSLLYKDKKWQAAEALKGRLDDAEAYDKSEKLKRDLKQSAATIIQRGEQPNFSQWKGVLPFLKETDTYVNLREISDFIAEYFDVPRNNIMGNIGKAAGYTTSDSGTKYPVVFFKKLPEVFGVNSDARNTLDNGGDLLGDNTQQQQAIADAERAKDEKRNTGDGNASDFVLTGSTRPADEAAARGAQDLFDGEDKPAFKRGEKSTDDVRDMFAQHNISEEGLFNADKVGGLAVPSLAVTKADLPLENFGEITLIAPKTLIDPKGKAGAKVFGADIYSPRYPEVIYDFDSKSIKSLNQKFSEAIEATGEGELSSGDIEKNPVRELKDKSFVRYYFLQGKGIKPNVVVKKPKESQQALLDNLSKFATGRFDPYELGRNQDFVDAYYEYTKTKRAREGRPTAELSEESKLNLARNAAFDLRDAMEASKGLVDRYPTREALRLQFDENLESEFNDYVNDLVDSLAPKEKLFEGYTYSGNRRYSVHTLDNVVKKLKKNLRGGENWNYGLGSVRSKFTPEFKSVAEIKKNKNRIVSTDYFEAVKAEQDAELMKISDKLAPYHFNSDKFGYLDTVTAAMTDAATMGVSRGLSENQFKDVPLEVQQDFAEFLTKLRNMPSEYFEAKVTRAVGLNEFAGAVVPDNVSKKAMEILKKNGIENIYTYSRSEGNRAGVIKEALNELGDVAMFKRDPMLDAIASLKQQQKQIVDDVQSYVDQVTAGWKNAPVINVVYDLYDTKVPQEIRNLNEKQEQGGATGTPSAFIYKNRVYIVASQMNSAKDVLSAVFHESLGHYGLRGVFQGKQAISAALSRVATMRSADVAKKAKQYGLDISKEADRLLAAEEVLAELAETRPEIGVVKQIIAAIRSWLRDNVPYFRNIELSDAEIIRDYILPARRFVEVGGKEQTAGDVVAAFDRPTFQRKESDQPKRSMIRDELGRFKSPTGIIYDKTADIVQILANKIAFGTAPKELRRLTRLYKADIQKAMEAAGNVVKTMSPMSQADRALVSDVVEKMVATGTVPPESIVNIATGIQNAMDIQTDELVKLGMLSQDSADRWRGKYLPRFYMREDSQGVKEWIGRMLRNSLPVRGIGGNSLKGRGLFEEVNVNEVPQFEALGWEVRDPLWKKNRQGELELVDENKVVKPEKVVVWRDWTPSERAEMGENRDALFRFVMGYTSMQNDIALGRLFDSIAKNQEWTRARASDGYVKVPDSEIHETGGVKRYGNLAGLYVKKEILDHISQYEEASELWKYYRKALSFWKAGKTVLNPVAHVNNVVSNLTMAHFAGVSYWDSHKYIAAIKDLAKNAPMVQEAKDRGLMTGDITRAELMADMPDDIKAMMEMQESQIKKSAKTVFNALTLWIPHLASKPMGKAYRFEDDFFKYLIYRDARKNGLSPDDAVDYATKYIFTYDDLPKGARTVRDLAIPFFAYTYKAVPALTHTLLNYPWRFAAPAAAVWGVNAIAFALAAGDDGDDWQAMYEKGKELEEEERKNLPPWMQGRSALGASKSIRLGTDDKTQLPVYMDVSRMIPGGDIFDVTNQADGVPVPAPIMPSNPVLTTIAAMFWNKDTFTGKEVVDRNDTGSDAAKKRAGWLLKQITPAIAPTGYHADKLAEAAAQMSGETISIPIVNFGNPVEYTGYGKDGLPVQAKYAAEQTFGIKARPIDLAKSARMNKGADYAQIRSIEAEMFADSRLLRRRLISSEEFERRKANAREKIKNIRSPD